MTKRSYSVIALLIHFLSLLLLMAVFSFPPEPAKKQLSKWKNKQRPSSSSWDQIKNLLTCKQIQNSKIHDPSKNNSATLLGSSCSSICPSGDVVHGNTRVCHRSDNSLGQETRLLSKKSSNWSSSSSSSSTSISSSVRSSSGGGGGSTYTAGSSKGMHFSKLSGCYECHAIVDHTRYPSFVSRKPFQKRKRRCHGLPEKFRYRKLFRPQIVLNHLA